MNEKEATSQSMPQSFLLHDVEPANLHYVWPFIERGLTIIRQRSEVDWLNEDVYSALRTGNAALMIPFFLAKPLGFVIYYYNWTPFSNKRECFIWCAYTIPLVERSEADEVDDAVKACFDKIEERAREAGAVRMACISSRKGFSRWSARFGFRPAVTTYVKELT